MNKLKHGVENTENTSKLLSFILHLTKREPNELKRTARLKKFKDDIDCDKLPKYDFSEFDNSKSICTKRFREHQKLVDIDHEI